MTRERAALAVIEQALSKALVQLHLAHSAGHHCGKPLSHELEDLVAHATELRQQIVNANGLVAAAATRLGIVDLIGRATTVVLPAGR